MPGSLLTGGRPMKVINHGPCMPAALLAAALLAGAGALQAADGERFPGVEKLMSADEYRAAGLDKLTDEEREALNRWLIGYTIGEAPVIRDSNPEVKKADREQVIRARITGAFSGWSGDTLFRLDNGQVWQQRQD